MNEQTKMIEKAKVNFEATGMRLVKIDSRLNEIVASVDTCKLWSIIVVEIILIILVLF